MIDHLIENIDQRFLHQQTRLLCDSYLHWTGQHLIDGDPSTPQAVRDLFEADFALLSHGMQSDPVFNYANRNALQLFGMSWHEITQLPSRYSAEPMLQNERADFLTRVAQHGFVDDYSDVRIAKNGRKFMIINATVWNLIDVDGNFCGQAAMLPEWHTI
ncbi:MAG: MEKHLA domain-containing protein [Nitrosomonadales bacterium]|nr:MEKHLA domain-containing protein [Nitrosomonadales bacterium]